MCDSDCPCLLICLQSCNIKLSWLLSQEAKTSQHTSADQTGVGLQSSSLPRTSDVTAEAASARPEHRPTRSMAQPDDVPGVTHCTPSFAAAQCFLALLLLLHQVVHSASQGIAYMRVQLLEG